MTAIILAFPEKPAPLPLVAAMARLEAALATQRVAIQEWRQQIAHLRDSMHGLGVSVQTYNIALGHLASTVSTPLA